MPANANTDAREIVTADSQREIDTLARNIWQRLEYLTQFVPDDARGQLEAVWQEVERVAEIKEGQIVKLMALAIAVSEQRDAIAGELADLDAALDDPFSTDNRRVEQLVEDIRASEFEAANNLLQSDFQDWKELHQDALADEALEDADEAARDSIIEDIAAMLDISTFEAYDVLAAITGDATNQLSDEQAEIVRRLFNQVQEGAA